MSVNLKSPANRWSGNLHYRNGGRHACGKKYAPYVGNRSVRTGRSGHSLRSVADKAGRQFSTAARLGALVHDHWPALAGMGADVVCSKHDSDPGRHGRQRASNTGRCPAGRTLGRERAGKVCRSPELANQRVLRSLRHNALVRFHCDMSHSSCAGETRLRRNSSVWDTSFEELE